MSPSFANETLSTALKFSEAPQPKLLSARLKLLLRAIEIASFMGMIAAFILLLLGAGSRDGEIFWPFIGQFVLFLIPAAALAATVGVQAHFDEREHMFKLLQAQLDRLQNRLDYRENMLNLVSDHQPGVLMIFDRHNRYWFANDRAAKKLGRTIESLIGQPPVKVLGTDKAHQLELRLAEARASGQPLLFVDRQVEAEGTRFVQSRFEALVPVADQTNCVIVVEDDVTDLIVERERRERMLRQVIDTLVAVVDRRDPYASGHSARVGQLSRAIAEEMHLSTGEVEATEIAGSLMNFGKVLVSRQILTKTTALTPEELQRVRDSILISADILSIIGFDGPVVPTLRQVLERVDGAGVPQGLKGEDIILTARIVTVANAFVAFVSPRAHRDGLPFDQAVKRMLDESGRCYDHKVLVALSHYLENHPNKLDWLRPSRPAAR